MKRLPADDRRVSAFLRLARLNILPGGILAYTLGAVMAYAHSGAFRTVPFALGLLLTIVANLSAHFANEFADVDSDTLAHHGFFSGGSGVLPQHLLPKSWALAAALACVGLALMIALWGLLSGWLPSPAAWILGVGLLGGWYYSMPPLQLARHGLAELVNGVIGGMLMPLMGYVVQADNVTSAAVQALLPVPLLVIACLLSIHWADRDADAAVGKRTLVVLLGAGSVMVWRVLAVLAYLLALLQTGGAYPPAVTIALWLTLPFATWLGWTMPRQRTATPGALLMGAVLVAEIVGWLVVAL